jgi:hypothetical protein
MLRIVLLVNGIVDILAAGMLVLFPAAGWRIPGHDAIAPATAFAAGGWAISTLALGISRLWAACVPAFRGFTGAVALIEGSLLGTFCLVRLATGAGPFAQVAMALPVGTVFPVCYAIGLFLDRRTRPRNLRRPGGTPAGIAGIPQLYVSKSVTLNGWPLTAGQYSCLVLRITG